MSYEEPLTDEERDGALGALVEALTAAGDDQLLALADALRRGGDLNASWAQGDETVVVRVAVPPGEPLDLANLEDRIADVVRRVVASCGLRAVGVRLTLALAATGWRAGPRGLLPSLLAGRYEREADPFKSGGFGAVYKATDRFAEAGGITEPNIAIKVLRFPGSANAREREQYFLRFRREMDLMEHLRHANIMSVLWYGAEEDGTLWYAMPLADGSLADRLPEFRLDPDRILSVFASICDGVTYLHEQKSVVHRDLAPGNVLYMPDGSWVISDLGLAFDLDREFTQLTVTGMSMGTVGYRPPDVEAQLAKDATPAWDIYSLGQLLADMTAGQLYTDRSGQVPDSVFKSAITRAINPEPARRYSSARDFLEDCRRLMELSKPWENPEARRSRLVASLQAGDVEAAHELALRVGRGDSTETFASALSSMSNQTIAQFATETPDDLKTLTVAVLDEMPGQWTQFEQLDPMARFVIGAAEALDDDDISERTVKWVLETGHGWNRWNVQHQATDYLRRLGKRSPEVVARALDRTDARAIPEDLSWLHPAARPKGVATPTGDDDVEPF